MRPYSAVILAPLGRDAAVAAQLLRGEGIASKTCEDLPGLLAKLGEDTCFAILTEEALRTADLRGLSQWIAEQPPWSDLPMIIITHKADAGSLHPDLRRLSDLFGNVMLIERPFHPLTFISVAQSAYRQRLRQYGARALIEDLRQSEEKLERRVAKRTIELEQAHAAILDEMGQREQAEEKLRQLQKMEMIGQLTGGVAHDFNNLLMAVIGNLDLLRKRTPPEHATQKLIDGAMQGAQRGAALTQRLLAFARRQDLNIEPADLGTLVLGMRDLIDRSIGSQIELSLAIEPGLPAVLIDANQVELAILNLVVNSRDAMPGGGRIAVHLGRAAPEQVPPALRPGSFLRLAVSDTGAGMDSGTLAKATEPFFSTKELGKGTGLGLSMIDGLARQLGGALKLSSAIGRGTTAELWLPTTALPVAAHVAAAEPADGTANKLAVLVVDDDVLISMSTAMMVEDLGHEVVEVNSGHDALDVLRSGREIDLLITDFSMPKMNGAELARAAKEIRPHLRILLASGYAELPVTDAPDFPRIGKPYQQEQLAAAVADAVGSRTESNADLDPAPAPPP